MASNARVEDGAGHAREPALGLGSEEAGVGMNVVAFGLRKARKGWRW